MHLQEVLTIINKYEHDLEIKIPSFAPVFYMLN